MDFSLYVNILISLSPSPSLSLSLPPAGSATEGLPPRVLMTITKLQCLLERKQDRISALERQVDDLMQDRKFLRSQIENLTSNRPSTAYVPSQPPAPATTEGWSLSCRSLSCRSLWSVTLWSVTLWSVTLWSITPWSP